MKLKFFTLAAIFLVNNVLATTITSTTTISYVASYSSNEWVIFKVAAPISECSDGYWIAKSDIGFQSNVSMILAAYAAKSTVVVDAFIDKPWPGSSAKFCKLNSLELK